MLEFRQVTKTFYDPGRGPVRAVDGIDLSINEGVTALIGANGAGKSTLLRLAATLLVPDSGSITFAGIDAVRDGERLRARLGYLSTTTRLPPRLTVREVLRFQAGLLGMDAASATGRIEDLRARFGLASIIDQRCQGLSTGQAQRAALARTLLGDPDLLILDEPTTGLDVVMARALVEAIRDVRRAGRVVVVATHVMAEVEAVADHAVVVRDGRIAFEGALEHLRGGAGSIAAAVHDLLKASA